MPLKNKGGYVPAKEMCMLLPDINGGVRFTANSGENGDNVCSDILNMWFKDGILKTRPGLARPFPDFAGGEIHSVAKREFFGRIVFHCGDKIAAFDMENEPEIIFEGIDDCESFFCEIGSALFLYTQNESIYKVDAQFCVEKTEPYVPTVIRNADNNLKSYDAYEEFNLLSRKITVRYKYSSYISTYTLPFDADTSVAPHIKFNGSDRVFSSTSYFISKKRIKFYTSVSAEYIEITYTIEKGSDADKTGMIFRCRFSECFGGTSMEGTRLFLSGNADYPGHYFRSELLNPTYFKELAFDIIGTGTEVVTAFAKYRNDMLVFTERSVGRITYSLTSEGAEFKVKEINSRIGCDMPGSIALVNNKIVFANSSGGVYIIDSIDNTDELNIVGISENIMGCGSGNVKKGFAFESKADKAACCHADYDGYYMLFIGDGAYVWDYETTPFYASANQEKAQRRLAWYIFDGMNAAHCIVTSVRRLFIFRRDEQTPCVLSEDFTEDFGLPIHSYFVTKGYDAGFPHLEKNPDRILITLSNRKNSHVRFGVYDGAMPHAKALYSRELGAKRFCWGDFSWDNFNLEGKTSASHTVRLPPMKKQSFSVKLECEDGVFGAWALECIFKKDLRQKG